LQIFVEINIKNGATKSLSSFGMIEPDAGCLVKISSEPLSLNKDFEAKLPNYPGVKKIPLLTIPHYLTARLAELLNKIIKGNS